MKLSIIVPVYKARRYLQNCIESILQQTYTDYELILVDDGSPDGSGTVCDRYAQECDKVKVIHKKNGGLSSARNAGIAVAQGEYITFVDADDIVASGTYYYNMRILLANPDIDIIEYPVNIHYESPQSEIISFKPEKVTGNNNIFIDWIKRKGYNHSYACNKIFRSDLFTFVRFPEGEVFEDLYIAPMLYGTSECVYYSDCGFYYYIDRKESISNSYSAQTRFFLYRNFVNLYKKVKKEYKMEQEANEMLLICCDRLTDLLRCSDGDKKLYTKAIDMLNNEKIDIKTLYHMEIPMRQKLKFMTLALFGAPIHCRINALVRRKLC